jgi:hypothetical protein
MASIIIILTLKKCLKFIVNFFLAGPYLYIFSGVLSQISVWLHYYYIIK